MMINNNKKQTKRRSVVAVSAVAVLALSSSSANAFAPTATIPTAHQQSSSALFAVNEQQQQQGEPVAAAAAAESSRRDMLKSSMSALFGAALSAGVVSVANPEAASASYSAFANREADWEQRQKSGDIKVSTARDLRNQLREIVPQNSEGSKIFCPNGPSANVSPLMENKCGDRQATASVFGRTEDTVGNSVPGFNGGRYAGIGGTGTALVGELGGLNYGDVGSTPGRANGKLVAR